MDEHFFIYNGLLVSAGTPFLDERNRAFKYGDGLFETMRVYKGKIVNQELHFERFFKGLRLLKISFPRSFSENLLIQNIHALLNENHVDDHARLRLMAFRGGTNLMDNPTEEINYLIEAVKLDAPVILNQPGLKVDLFEDAQKSCDVFSNVKTNNYLSSIMAILYANEHLLDECFLLNAYGRVCESAISNIFIIHQQKVITPSLSEGCVEGVVRRWLIENLPQMGLEVIEKKVPIEEVWEAEEIFLTNSLKWVRWIKEFRGKVYTHEKASEIAQFVFKNMIDKT